MSRKIEIIVACSTFALLLTAAAQAREVRVNQRYAGSCINPTGAAPGSSDCILELKGAPGAATARAVVSFGGVGPPSEQCAGFDFEIPLLSAAAVETLADLSQIWVVLSSGFLCGNVDGTQKTLADVSVVGGTGRFEGASGTLSLDHDVVVLNQGDVPQQDSITGAITGTITVP